MIKWCSTVFFFLFFNQRFLSFEHLLCSIRLCLLRSSFIFTNVKIERVSCTKLSSINCNNILVNFRYYVTFNFHTYIYQHFFVLFLSLQTFTTKASSLYVVSFLAIVLHAFEKLRRENARRKPDEKKSERMSVAMVEHLCYRWYT